MHPITLVITRPDGSVMCVTWYLETEAGFIRLRNDKELMAVVPKECRDSFLRGKDLPFGINRLRLDPPVLQP